MKITRHGAATWQGGFKDGRGAISSGSGALDSHPYGFGSRFEGVAGTNPEELIAAAHAGCFTMALSLLLSEAGHTATRLDTSASVTLESVPDGFAITKIHLRLNGSVPGLDAARFDEFAYKAKLGCPVSKVLKAEITLAAEFTP